MISRTGYKVVTSAMKSLGLRRNPHILKYPVGKWFRLPQDSVVPGDGDYGGIWVARTLSGARRLEKYLKERYGIRTRVFRCRLGRVLYANSYRIKTDAIFLAEELPSHWRMIQ